MPKLKSLLRAYFKTLVIPSPSEAYFTSRKCGTRSFPLDCARGQDDEKPKGFSLIELLVAITVMGGLAALLLANFLGARERGRDSQRKNDLYQLKGALRLYYNDYQGYPSNDSQGRITGSNCPGGTCTWGAVQFGTASIYMKKLPADPTITSYYYYQIDSENFNLYACLENKSDSSGESDCGTIACASSWCLKVYSD